MSAANRFKALVPAILIVTLLSACEPQPPARQPGREKVHILVVGESKDSPSSAILRAAAIRFTHENAYATVDFLVPESRSPTAQQALLRSIKQREFDALCIVPINAAAIRSLVDAFVIDGKLVVTIARDIRDSRRAIHCGPSESQIGRLAAAACAIATQDRTKTVMLLHSGMDETSSRRRRIGFKDELATIHDTKLIAEYGCRDDPLEASRLVTVKAKSYPRTGCWVYLDDWPLRTIKPTQRLLPPSCGLILCNGSPDHFDRLRSGEIDAIIAFDYFQAVDEAIRAAARIVRTGEPDSLSFIEVPAEIITAKELDWHERRWDAWRMARPSPDESRW